MDPQRALERRVAGGKLAKQVLAAVVIPPGADERRFWEVVAAHAVGQLGLAVVPAGQGAAPMDDQEAGRFAASLMPYGKYTGEQVRDVDPDYLAFITETPFARNLPRFMASAYYRRLHSLPG